jgi:hypothetical protein
MSATENRKIRNGIRKLDHAIDHLGPTRPCMLLVHEGGMHNIPGTSSNADAARAVLVGSMLGLVRELCA